MAFLICFLDLVCTWVAHGLRRSSCWKTPQSAGPCRSMSVWTMGAKKIGRAIKVSAVSLTLQQRRFPKLTNVPDLRSCYSFLLKGKPNETHSPLNCPHLDLDIRETFVTPSQKQEMTLSCSFTGAHPRSPAASHWFAAESIWWNRYRI